MSETADNSEPVGGSSPHGEEVIEILVLASIDCWMQKSNRFVEHNAAKKGFVHGEIRDASEKIHVAVGQQFHARRGSANRKKNDMFLDDILTCLYTLGDQGHLSKITVNSMDLARMPLVAVAEGDCVEVSTRISLMGKGMTELKDSVKKLVSSENNLKDL